MSRVITYEPLRSVDSATLMGAYLKLGTPLAHPASIVKLVNNSTVLITISIDGVTDHDVVPPNSFFLYDETSNSPVNISEESVYMPQGTQYYISGSVGTGLVYLVVQYNKRP